MYLAEECGRSTSVSLSGTGSRLRDSSSTVCSAAGGEIVPMSCLSTGNNYTAPICNHSGIAFKHM